jgi:hypothetical protein
MNRQLGKNKKKKEEEERRKKKKKEEEEKEEEEKKLEEDSERTSHLLHSHFMSRSWNLSAASRSSSNTSENELSTLLMRPV